MKEKTMSENKWYNNKWQICLGEVVGAIDPYCVVAIFLLVLMLVIACTNYEAAVKKEENNESSSIREVGSADIVR